MIKSVKLRKCKGNRFFSEGAFRDTFARLRVTALIFLAVCVVISVLSLSTSYLEWKTYRDSLGNAAPAEKVAFDSITEVAPGLSIFMYLGGLLLTMSALSFLNKRSSSDFYHAVPLTRTALFLSSIAAVVAWAAIVIVVTLGVTVVSCILTGMIFTFSFLPYLLLTYFIGTMSMVAITALAASITGTRFSNLILVGLILFLPRFISVLCTVGVTNASVIVPMGDLGILFDVSYNLPVALLLSSTIGTFFLGMDAPAAFFTNYSTLIYTACMTLLYLGLALLAFKKRKSECAGYSAPSPVFQALYRCAIAFPPMMILGIIIVIDPKGIDVASVLILIILSLGCYVLYEILTRRDAKKLAKALPLFLVVPGIALVLSLATYGVADYQLHKLPDKEDIQWVTIDKQRGYEWYGQDPSYYDYKLADIRFENEDLYGLCLKSLEGMITTVDNTGDVSDFTDVNRNSFTVTIKMGASKIKRVIYFNDTDYALVQEYMQGDEKYAEAVTGMPTDKEIATVSIGNLSSDEAREMLEVYRAEFVQLSAENAIALTEPGVSRIPGQVIVITGYVHGEYYSSIYCLSAEYTPETVKKYVTLLSDDVTNEDYAQKMDNSMEFLNDIFEAKGTSDEEKKESVYSGSFELRFFAGCNSESVIRFGGLHLVWDNYGNEDVSLTLDETETKELMSILKNAKIAQAGDENILGFRQSGYASDYDEETDSYISREVRDELVFISLSERDCNRLYKLLSSVKVNEEEKEGEVDTPTPSDKV